MKLLKNYPRVLHLLFAIVFLFSGFAAKATHIVGTDMFYKHLSGTTYKITIILYADCGPSSAGAFASLPTASPNVCIYNGDTLLPSMPIFLAIEPPTAGIEITPVCPDSLPRTQCVNPYFNIPGIKKFVYSATYTLPYRSATWRFVFNGYHGGGTAAGTTYAGRAAAITNLVLAANTTMQLIDTLNNLTQDNSSPTMSVIPTPYYCLNQNNGYTPGALDIEGDRLVFDLVSATNGAGAWMPPSCAIGGNVTYTGTAWPGQLVGPATPLRCVAGSFVFDTMTGQIDFLPNFIQRAVVVYNIREYRGGVLVGTCQREMTFLVRPCVNLPPSGIYDSATAGMLIDSTHFEICANSGPFSIYVNPRDPEGNGITITAAGLPPGATFTTTGSGTPTPQGVFSWNSTGVAPGVYIFYLTFKDNHCPEYGAYTRAFVVTITPPLPPITGATAVCVGSTISMGIAISGGTWSVSPPLVATVSATGVVTGVSAGTATVTYTSTAGCRSFAEVTVDPIPAGAITGASMVCPGGSISLTPPPYSGTWSVSWGAVTVSASGVVTGVTPGGTGTISYTIPTMCGVSSYLFMVTVHTLPTVNPITGPTTVCVGSTITLANTTPGGLWSISGGVATISSGGVVTGVSGGTATATYKVGNVCDSVTATYVVSIDTPIIVPPITGPGTLCPGTTIVLTNTAPGGTWSSVVPTIATISAGGVVTGITSGTTIISYTLSNTCGSAAATTVVTVLALPVVGPIVGPSSVCLGLTVALTCTPGGGTWTSSGTATVSPTGVVNGVSGGLSTISYSVSNTCGTTTVTKIVTVNLFPDAGTLSGPHSVCEGSTITVIPSLPGGTWTVSGTGVAVSAAGVVTGLTAGTATITYTFVNGCGPASAYYVVTVAPTPSPGTLSGTAVLCIGGSTTLSSTVGGGVWSSVGAATVSSTGVVMGMATGTATVLYTVSLGLCSSVATYVVTVNTLPDPGEITADTSICIGQVLALTATVPGGVWTCADPAISISATGVVTGLSYGGATVTYTVTNMCGSVPVTTIVSVFPPPAPGTITGPHVLCMGATGTLTISSVAGTGTWVSGNAGIATVDIIGNITPVAPGTTTISYTVVNHLGCMGMAIHTVTVAPLPEPGIISGISTVCRDANITLTQTLTGGTWTSSNTGIATIDPVTGRVTVVGVGKVIVTYTTAPNSFGCSGKATHPLTIMGEAPFYINEAINDAKCHGSADGSIEVWASHGVGPWNIVWAHGATTATISGLVAGRYEVDVIDALTSCRAHEAYTIHEPDPLEIVPNVTSEKCAMGNGAIGLDVRGGTNPYRYLWNDNSTNDRLTAIKTGNYQVTVYDKNMCQQALRVDVIDGGCDDIEITNGVSPNGDGINDLWIIRGIENYPNNIVQLYDKWGDLVYEKRGYDNTWNGIGRAGKPLPDGTFFYVLKLNAENGAGGKNVWTGSILIKR